MLSTLGQIFFRSLSKSPATKYLLLYLAILSSFSSFVNPIATPASKTGLSEPTPIPSSQELQLKNEKDVLGAQTGIQRQVNIPASLSSVDVRSGPSIDTQVIARIWYTQKVNSYSESGDWVEIEINSLRGWINKKYLE